NGSLSRDFARHVYEVAVDLDSDTARAVFLRGKHDDAAVTGAEVVDDVLGRHAGEPEHGIGHRMSSWGEIDVRTASNRLDGPPHQIEGTGEIGENHGAERQPCRCQTSPDAASHGDVSRALPARGTARRGFDTRSTPGMIRRSPLRAICHPSRGNPP